MDMMESPAPLTLAAVDLGATSGRVILGGIAEGRLHMKHIARFPNSPLHLTETVPAKADSGPGSADRSAAEHTPAEGLYSNISSLYAALEDGLREAVRAAPGLRSIGIDSWAVDYGLLRRGRLLGLPHHYRDTRSSHGVDLVHARIDPADLYARNGLQHLDFNTVFQLAAEAETGLLDLADAIVLIPDLIAYWLTGTIRAELTNASTTGLLRVEDTIWDSELANLAGADPVLLPELIAPGQPLGTLTEAVAARLGAGSLTSATSTPDPGITVTAVGSHDTASAVVAVPFTTENSAFISSGTWSLVGLELDRPVLSEAARDANFTNEGGVDGTIRFLKNVSGLWLLSESMRHWHRHSTDAQRSADLQTLLSEAERVTGQVPIFDPSDDRFTPPGDMPTRIADWCREHGIRPPEGPAEIMRSILESLAEAYRETIETAEELTGRQVDVVHIVGGGSQNTLLCRLTAERTGRPVVAGPVEATAIGNLLVQARAIGEVEPNSDLADLRRIVRDSFPVIRYEP
ncbi:rhamnulokinase [Brevibacterium sp. GP-SGM9]|uniref:rhamnulokinase n=1 Tax=Brevibacterium sp. GP-SGM9 TaxID=3376990 RepID=UPI0039A57761